MFALWYLSFAIDEIRKHFGWFFGNIKIKGVNKAIENKQPLASQTEPQPQPQPKAAVTPKIAQNKPVPAPKPAQPAQPAPKPVVVPTPPSSPPKPIEKPAPVTPPTTPTTSPSIKSSPNPTTLKKEVAADALDKKLKEASKPFENGNEQLKANLKDATTGFLQNESQRKPERKWFMRRSRIFVLNMSVFLTLVNTSTF